MAYNTHVPSHRKDSRPHAGPVAQASTSVILVGTAGEIKIHVLEIDGGKVRLGITAPRDVPVYREEIWDAMQAGRAAEPEPDPFLPG